MKQWLSVILILLFFVFCSCDKKSESKSENVKILEIDTKYFVEKVAKLSDTTIVNIGDKPAIIDFYATWCGPCKMQTPVLEKLSEKYFDKLNIYKVDVDKSEDLAQTLKITGIPTLIFLPMNKKAPIIKQGFMSEEELEYYIVEYLLK